jgi:hypothetical protein
MIEEKDGQKGRIDQKAAALGLSYAESSQASSRQAFARREPDSS